MKITFKTQEGYNIDIDMLDNEYDRDELQKYLDGFNFNIMDNDEVLWYESSSEYYCYNFKIAEINHDSKTVELEIF